MKKLIIIALVLLGAVSCSPLDQMVGSYTSTMPGNTDTLEISKSSDGTYQASGGGKTYPLRAITKEESEKLFGDKLKWGTYTGLVSETSPLLIIKTDATLPELQIKKPGYYIFALLGFIELQKTK